MKIYGTSNNTILYRYDDDTIDCIDSKKFVEKITKCEISDPIKKYIKYYYIDDKYDYRCNYEVHNCYKILSGDNKGSFVRYDDHNCIFYYFKTDSQMIINENNKCNQTIGVYIFNNNTNKYQKVEIDIKNENNKCEYKHNDHDDKVFKFILDNKYCKGKSLMLSKKNNNKNSDMIYFEFRIDNIEYSLNNFGPNTYHF